MSSSQYMQTRLDIYQENTYLAMKTVRLQELRKTTHIDINEETTF